MRIGLAPAGAVKARSAADGRALPSQRISALYCGIDGSFVSVITILQGNWLLSSIHICQSTFSWRKA